jgi:SAM-dependent methyltransferase
MQFERVLSFGRTGAELMAMFALDAEHVKGLRILDCPGGPGSLTALLRQLGARPTAVDPSYALGLEELEAETRADIATVASQIQGDATFRQDFDYTSYTNAKLAAFQQFQLDREAHPGDYLAASLPDLPFADASFDLVLSGSLLFAYAPISDGGLMQEPGLDLAWHRQALAELLRVCGTELRLYPAHTFQGEAAHLHPYVEPLLAQLAPGWCSETFQTRYDQGIKGDMVGLRLFRPAPAPGG